MTNTKELQIYALSRNQKLLLQHTVHHLTECTYLPATPSIRPPRSAVRALALWFEAPTDVHFIPNTDNKIPKNPRPIAAIIKARHVCSTSEIIFKSILANVVHVWKSYLEAQWRKHCNFRNWYSHLAFARTEPTVHQTYDKRLNFCCKCPRIILKRIQIFDILKIGPNFVQ